MHKRVEDIHGFDSFWDLTFVLAIFPLYFIKLHGDFNFRAFFIY